MPKLELHYPVKPWIVSQNFGECAPGSCDLYKQLGLKGHNGMDIAVLTGTTLRAAHSGTVVFSGEDATAGHTISIRTDEKCQYGLEGAYFKSIYCHLKPGSIKVLAGQKVQVGDIIGLTGASGMVTGPHLHFGLKPVYQGEADWQLVNAEQLNGYYGAIDPLPYFSGVHAEDYNAIKNRYTQLIALLTQMLAIMKNR